MSEVDTRREAVERIDRALNTPTSALREIRELKAERDELRQALEQARDAALEEAAVAVGVLLPENGAGQPCDAIDRLIDATRRECVSSIRALQSTTTKEEE